MRNGRPWIILLGTVYESQHRPFHLGCCLEDFFDDIGKYFNPKGRNDDEEEGNTDENDDTVVVFTIPSSSVKVGALRLLLMLHLIGQQNIPSKGAWKCQQREEEE